MAIEGFDYKGFAQSMAEQAEALVPQDLKDFEKQYIVKTLADFTLKAGEALYNDTSLNLTPEQAIFITQVIAEWSFHKSVDLIHSGILPEFWDNIMQKIAFTIFEISKQAVINKIPEQQLLQVVESHVVKVYKQCVEELEKKGIIDGDVKEQAINQSNIDVMAQAAQQAQAEQAKAEQAQASQVQTEQASENLNNDEAKRAREEERAQRRANRAAKKAVEDSFASGGVTHKQLKLMSLALLLKVLSQDKVTTILNKFDQTDTSTIKRYMDMADLESHLDGDLIADCLKDMKSYLPIKRKLTKENVILDLINLYRVHDREKIEKVIKNERPLVKRFVAQAYDGEYGELPLKVAGIISDYITESV